MSTDNETSILKHIPENLRARLRLEVLREIEEEKKPKPGETSQMFKDVMESVKKEKNNK